MKPSRNKMWDFFHDLLVDSCTKPEDKGLTAATKPYWDSRGLGHVKITDEPDLESVDEVPYCNALQCFPVNLPGSVLGPYYETGNGVVSGEEEAARRKSVMMTDLKIYFAKEEGLRKDKEGGKKEYYHQEGIEICAALGPSLSHDLVVDPCTKPEDKGLTAATKQPYWDSRGHGHVKITDEPDLESVDEVPYCNALVCALGKLPEPLPGPSYEKCNGVVSGEEEERQISKYKDAWSSDESADRALKVPGVGETRDASSRLTQPAPAASSAGAAAGPGAELTGLGALLNRQSEIWKGRLACPSD
ncbi:hypothetical protein P7K49_014404 [Saguinus oedipus]|uniref:Uncharacterized protein n=1 Tax=Saguinus oedipus TaxID=9490 RepID=A0ABQ9VK37_SAGOE|nr:hypothetical protein P7K49_014404 [Saguinus oedipus]